MAGTPRLLRNVLGVAQNSKSFQRRSKTWLSVMVIFCKVRELTVVLSLLLLASNVAKPQRFEVKARLTPGSSAVGGYTSPQRRRHLENFRETQRLVLTVFSNV